MSRYILFVETDEQLLWLVKAVLPLGVLPAQQHQQHLHSIMYEVQPEIHQQPGAKQHLLFCEKQLHHGMVPQKRQPNAAKCGFGSKASSSLQVIYAELLLLVPNFSCTCMCIFLYFLSLKLVPENTQKVPSRNCKHNIQSFTLESNRCA